MKPGIRARLLLALFATGLATLLLPTVSAVAGAPRCFGERATIVGTARGEVIRGTPRADVIVALGGADVINGRGGNDVICGGRGNDRIVAGAGNFDVLFGQSGDDELLGGGGFDLLVGGSGDDLVDGGGGEFDAASFFFAPAAVTVDLAAGTATGDGSDVIQAVEQVEGSRFNDTITGDAGANGFYPEGGDDVIVGGDGLDTIYYLFATGPVTVDLAAGTATGEGSDSLTGVENVAGSDFGDTISGDAGPNTITGGPGDDVLNGADGNDILDGEDGNDTLDGGAGTDTCSGETVSNCEG